VGSSPRVSTTWSAPDRASRRTAAVAAVTASSPPPSMPSRTSSSSLTLSTDTPAPITASSHAADRSATVATPATCRSPASRPYIAALTTFSEPGPASTHTPASSASPSTAP
jgi:hypothetical protein